MAGRAEELAVEAAREGGKPLIDSRVEVTRAIAAANSLPVAFQAAVCTRDIDTALYVYRHIDASAVMVNDHTAFRVDWMPFAGLRQSGHGIGGIHHSLRDMQIEKMMVMRSKVL